MPPSQQAKARRVQAPTRLRTALWRVCLSQLIPLALITLIALGFALADGKSLAVLGASLVGAPLLHLVALTAGPILGLQHWQMNPDMGFYPAALLPGLLLMVAGFLRIRNTSGQVMASLGLWAWSIAGWLGLSLIY